MRLLFVADFRSPIALNWISFFVERGHEVHVVSSYPVSPSIGPLASLHVLPVAFASLVRNESPSEAKNGSRKLPFLPNRWRNTTERAMLSARNWLGSAELFRYVPALRKIIRKIKPDLVHAMRIPFEGILASRSIENEPFLLSVWGNDLTLHANGWWSI